MMWTKNNKVMLKTRLSSINVGKDSLWFSQGYMAIGCRIRLRFKLFRRLVHVITNKLVEQGKLEICSTTALTGRLCVVYFRQRSDVMIQVSIIKTINGIKYAHRTSYWKWLVWVKTNCRPCSCPWSTIPLLILKK